MSFLNPYWYLLKNHKRDLIYLQILMIIRPFVGGAGFMLIVPLLTLAGIQLGPETGLVNDLLKFLPRFDNLLFPLTLFFAIMMAIALADYLQSTISERLQQNLFLALRRDLFRSVMYAEWQHLSLTHHADYARIVTEEAESIGHCFSSLINFVNQLFLILIYTGICLLLSVPLTIAAITLGLLVLLLSTPLQSFILKIAERHLSASSRLFRDISAQIRGMREIKGAGLEEQYLEQNQTSIRQIAQQDILYTRFSAATNLVHSLVSAIAFCLLAYTAIDLVELPGSSLIVLALIFSRLVPQLNGLHGTFEALSYLKPSVNEVTALKQLCDSNREADQVSMEFDLAQGIQLSRVGFKYPETSELVLRELNGVARPGQLIAIVGASGIGKSTLADLLAGVSTPTHGQISVGDTEIKRANLSSWRQLVTYVPQDPFFVDASIRQNLTMLTTKDVSEQEFTQALKRAGANFAYELPQSIDTRIGEDGLLISAGQKQRLAIARAFLEKSPVMILDEATSNIDLESEQHILQELLSQRGDSIVFVVSHRTSVLEIADQIINID